MRFFAAIDFWTNSWRKAEELAEIAIQSADSAKAFGLDPRIAMISYSTGTSGAGAEVEKVAEATRIAKERRPDLLIDGPLQYDAASVQRFHFSKHGDRALWYGLHL
jgi:phosphate acetyltransferase